MATKLSFRQISKRKITLALFLSFLSYGVVLILSFYLFNSYLLDKKFKEQFKLKVKLEAKNKERYLNLYLENLINSLKAVAYNPYFLSYVLDRDYLNSAEFLFLTIMLEHNDYMQLRFLDESGMELLRYERDVLGSSPYKREYLQDKSARYYFQEAKKLKEGDIYISKIDYNIENGKVVQPIVPVFRVSTPIYIKEKFKGVLTINTFAKKIIKIFSSSPIFNTIIFDKDGYLIYANGKYYDKEHNPKTIKEFLFLKDIQLPLKKNDEYLLEDKKIYIKAIKMGNQILDVAYIIKPDIVPNFKSKDYRLLLIALFGLFILAFPLSFLLSRPTIYMIDIITKQDTKLKELTKTLEKKIEQKTLENAKKDRLIIHQARLAELGEMIGNIAHQWRHPLTRLSLTLQNIKAFNKKGLLKEERLESMLKVANEQIFFMSDTIDNFKDFYKPTNGESEFLIKDSYDRVINIVGYDLKHKNITISYSQKRDIKLFGDINQLSQILLNLITNARDVLVEREIKNPKISVEVEDFEKEIKIVVSDNGGGIKKDNLKRVFQPYFSTKTHGSGVGLYMVLTIVESKFGGKIEVSNSKSGAIFEILIKKRGS